MKKNSMLVYAEVCGFTAELCTFKTGDIHDILHVPVHLVDQDEEKRFITTIVCREDEKEQAVKDIQKNNGLKKEDYSVPGKYCHICTHDDGVDNYFISFDKQDDYPVKANFNQEYTEVSDFFESFIRFRTKLLEKGEIVKSDDLYQYYLAVTRGFNSKNKNKKSFKEKVKSLFGISKVS